MQASNIPTKFQTPFASSAGAGFTRTVPLSPTGTVGQASLQTGFPPANFNPVAAGGVPPFGQDFNGLLNQITAWNQWVSAGGGTPTFDGGFSSVIGGYPQGAFLSALSNPGHFWISLVDNNTVNPDSGPSTQWLPFPTVLTANLTIFVNSTTGNDSFDGTQPTISGTKGPLQHAQTAINKAFNYPPSQFTITIQLADGTYPEALLTPPIPGPSLIINGNAGSPSNVLVTGLSTGQNTITVTGPNVLTVQNLKFTTGTFANSPPVGLSAGSGATLNTANTVNGFCHGSAIEAQIGGTVFVGNHTVTGNCGTAIYAVNSGNMFFNNNQVTTISTAVTVTYFDVAESNGSITYPQSPFTPTFVNPGNVTGSKYFAFLNGVINTVGQGINYLPGSTAGSTSSGGQYG